MVVIMIIVIIKVENNVHTLEILTSTSATPFFLVMLLCPVEKCVLIQNFEDKK